MPPCPPAASLASCAGTALLVALGCALAGLAWGWVSGGYLVFSAADRQEVMRRLAQLLGGGVVGAAWGASLSGIRNGWLLGGRPLLRIELPALRWDDPEEEDAVSVEDDAEDGEQALRLILADAARAIRALRRKARSDDAQRARIATLGRIINYGALALSSLPDESASPVRNLACGAADDPRPELGPLHRRRRVTPWRRPEPAPSPSAVALRPPRGWPAKAAAARNHAVRSWADPRHDPALPHRGLRRQR